VEVSFIAIHEGVCTDRLMLVEIPISYPNTIAIISFTNDDLELLIEPV